MKFAITLFFAAIGLIGLSFNQTPYRNGQSTFIGFANVEQGNSEQYHAAREEELSAKYALQDYGISLTLLGIVLIGRNKRLQLPVPRSMLGFTALALFACTSTGAAFVFDLIQGMHREEFPPWADSIGIPLMGTPVLLLIGLVWAFVHLALLREVRRQRVFLSIAGWRRSGLWLKVISAATGLLVVLCLAAGEYWYAIPFSLWLYFYLSLAAVRSADQAGGSFGGRTVE